MYKGILDCHITVVIAFLIIYAIKNFLLLTDKIASLENFTRRIKITEMIISTLFLATGIYLWINTGNAGPWLYVKLCAVLVSIPLAIIGFKRKNKVLALFSYLLLIYAYGLAETKSLTFHKTTPTETEKETIEKKAQSGEVIYSTNCAGCHGESGNARLSGATDLTLSNLDSNAVKVIISQGKGQMPAFKPLLSPQEIQNVSNFVRSLHK